MRDAPQVRSIEQLTTPRPVMMPPPDVFDSDLAEIESSLRSSVPEEILKRIRTARNLLVYGAFCYEFVSVAVLWCLTCVEMALWEKFTEVNPGPLPAEDRKGNRVFVVAKQLAFGLPPKYRLVGMPKFNGSFRSLVIWGTEQGLVSEPERLDSMVKLRNSFAHPKEFNTIWSPGMAVTIFQSAIEIIGELWPLEKPSTRRNEEQR